MPPTAPGELIEGGTPEGVIVFTEDAILDAFNARYLPDGTHNGRTRFEEAGGDYIQYSTAAELIAGGFAGAVASAWALWDEGGGTDTLAAWSSAPVNPALPTDVTTWISAFTEEAVELSVTPPPAVPAALIDGEGAGAPDAPAVLVEAEPPAIAATATVNVAVGLTSGQTITIAGVYVYTALVPDNGAEARIFDDAASLVEAINGLRTGVAADPNVSASAVGTLVTLTARTGGTAGNAITLAKSGAALTISGATFSGGVDLPVAPGSLV